MVHIVKRRGHKQEFDEKKLYASIYAACLSAHIEKEKAAEIAVKASAGIKEWVAGYEEVTSDQIFKQVSEQLMNLDKDAAFMYTTHRDVS